MTQKQMIEQFPATEKRLSLAEIALHQIANDAVTWGKWIRDDEGCKHRVGISVRRAYELVIVQFRGVGQDISVSDIGYLHEFEPALWQRRVQSECWQALCEALQSAKDAVRTQSKEVA